MMVLEKIIILGAVVLMIPLTIVHIAERNRIRKADREWAEFVRRNSAQPKDQA
jgi:pilus assembly protein TadC